MHDHSPSDAPSPPPLEDHHHHHHYTHHNPPPPDYPPPSYDDATGSDTTPLLVGAPPDYGAFRAYTEPDESSIASSEVEATDRTLPEWVGQALVVVTFISIIYGFWTVINAPDDPSLLHPGPRSHPG